MTDSLSMASDVEAAAREWISGAGGIRSPPWRDRSAMRNQGNLVPCCSGIDALTTSVRYCAAGKTGIPVSLPMFMPKADACLSCATVNVHVNMDEACIVPVPLCQTEWCRYWPGALGL